MTGRKLKDDSSLLPRNPRIGQLHYDSMTETMRKWNGKNWTEEVEPGEYEANIYSD